MRSKSVNLYDQRGDEDVHGDALGVNGRQVGVFEEGDEVRLRGLLKSEDSGRLEAEVGLRQRVSPVSDCM
jgi:hypothetical protein